MTREVKIRNLTLGGNNPIYIQSMTNTDTRDIVATSEQINALSNAGAHIVRFSVYDMDCAKAIRQIKANTNVPLVADIHFDYKLAIAAAQNGIDKLRINPGNIGAFQNVVSVCNCAKDYGLPIRIGINSGSLEKDLLDKYGSPCPDALCESAMRHVRLLEKAHFYDTVISIKASNVKNTVVACKKLAAMCNYPLHIGVTESGLGEMGIIKSAIGIGSLLLDGIGSTIRVSLTGDPIKEVRAAKQILRAIGLDTDGYVEIISCPTCGRTTGDHESVVHRIETALANIKPSRHLKIAVMGCVVNGPGEAREADLGIAFAPKGAAVFSNGSIAYSGEREQTLNRFIDDCIKLADS